ncbi:MAG: membrane protein insertion efficiency factor YidD [Verrucomicrobiota bacterium]|jgi:putative membrane protein insertion efficiency factor|nr:membrane protein insertion efficiency factor YidD [Verrucomicrobiota bacterium]
MRRLVALAGRAVGGALILLVRAYQVVLSPHIGNCCRFEPSCSAYSIEAIRTHGVLRGCWLTFRRVMRCRPFGPSGYDPVPPKGGGPGGDQVASDKA